MPVCTNPKKSFRLLNTVNMKCFLFSSSNGFTTLIIWSWPSCYSFHSNTFPFSQKVFIYIDSEEGVDVCAGAEIQALPAHIFLVLWHFLSMYLFWIWVCRFQLFSFFGLLSLLQSMYQTCSQLLIPMNHLLTCLSHNRKPIPNTNVDSKWNFW